MFDFEHMTTMFRMFSFTVMAQQVHISFSQRPSMIEDFRNLNGTLPVDAVGHPPGYSLPSGCTPARRTRGQTARRSLNSLGRCSCCQRCLACPSAALPPVNQLFINPRPMRRGLCLILQARKMLKNCEVSYILFSPLSKMFRTKRFLVRHESRLAIATRGSASVELWL